MAGKVVGLGFEIISKLDSYFLMTVSMNDFTFRMEPCRRIVICNVLEKLVFRSDSVCRKPFGLGKCYAFPFRFGSNTTITPYPKKSNKIVMLSIQQFMWKNRGDAKRRKWNTEVKLWRLKRHFKTYSEPLKYALSPAKVPSKVFSILFKVHSAHCVN